MAGIPMPLPAAGDPEAVVTNAFTLNLLQRSKRTYFGVRAEMPYSLLAMLTYRDRFLTRRQIGSVAKAWNFKSGAPKRMVYAWVHLHSSLKMYVGCIEGDSSSWKQRVHSHLANANQRMKAPHTRGPPGGARKPYQLNDYMASHGLADLVCVPLEVLKGSSSREDVHACEQVWIQRFDAIVQGYNARQACTRVAAEPHTGGYASRRRFGWHDMHRRLFALQSAVDSQRVTLGTAVSFFAGYNLHTLSKIYATVALRFNFLGQDMPAEGMPIASSSAVWRVWLDTVAVVQSMLDVVLSVRMGRLRGAMSARRTHQSMFVTSLWHGAYHAISPQLRQAFKHPDAVSILQQAALPEEVLENMAPMFTYRYDAPMGVTWSNASKLARSLTQEDIDRIVAAKCVCDPTHPLHTTFAPSSRVAVSLATVTTWRMWLRLILLSCVWTFQLGGQCPLTCDLCLRWARVTVRPTGQPPWSRPLLRVAW